MRINVAIPEAHVQAPILDAALEATTRLDESLLKSGELEPFDMADPGVRWRPEPPGQEHFDHGLMVQGRGWGDCDDLAPWHAASLRATGRDRGARAVVKKSGPARWHAVVQRSSGRIDDPSRAAGMGGHPIGVRGAVQPPMFPRRANVGGVYIARPHLAMRPVVDPVSSEIEAWQARTDLPWHMDAGRSPTDVAMVSLHASPISSQALVGALEGAITIGACNGANEEHLDRLRCISDMAQGADWHDCARTYGREHADAASAVVGSFFRKLGRGLGRIARPLGRLAMRVAPQALQFIPGIGPVASQAFEAASPALQDLLEDGGHRPPYAQPPSPYAQAYPQPYPEAYAPPYAAPESRYPAGGGYSPPGYAAWGE
jgi:hypothetical protein